MKKYLFYTLSVLASHLTYAQVICTDVNPDITNSGNASLDIDLNNDNTADFRITSAQAGTLSFVVVQGSQIGTGNFVLTNGTGGALCLAPNTPIGSSSSTWTQMNSTNQQMVLVAGTATGPWAGASDQYLGLALAAGTNTYFGWARFSFSSTSNQYTFKEYAFQSSAGVQILAGEDCGSVALPKFFLPDTVCAGSTFTVIAQTGTETPTSYSWAASPGTSLSASSASSTSFTFNTIGTASVLLYVANSSTSGFVLQTVAVTGPTISIMPPATTTVCAGGSLTLTALSNASTFSWVSNPASSISNPTSQSIVVTPTTSTNYLVQATLSGCTAIANRIVVVNAMPPMIIATSPTVICANPKNGSKNTATITVSGYTFLPASGAGLTLTPNPSGNSALITTIPPYLTSGAMLTTTLQLTKGSCTTSLVQSFSIAANPELTLTASSSTVCSTEGHTVYVSGANVYSISFSPLTMSVNTAPGMGFVFWPTTNATYSILGTSIPAQCRSDVFTNALMVIPGPTLTATSATACISEDVMLSSSGADTYTWVGPSGMQSYGGNVTISAPSSSGIVVYTVTGTSSNFCTGSTQSTIEILECASLIEQNKEGIVVYPQPADGTLYVSSATTLNTGYSIIDINGKQIISGTLYLDNGETSINLENIPAGVYMLVMDLEEEKILRKIIKR